MFNFFRKLRLVLKYGPEVEELLVEKNQQEALRRRALYEDNLNLCFEHQQEDKHSHYSENNCDYCKLLKQVQALKK